VMFITDEVDAFKKASNEIATALGEDGFVADKVYASPAESENLAHQNAIRQGMYAEGPFKYWWIARMFVRSLEPPPRFRAKSPNGFHPPAGRTRREIMAAFRAYQVQYIDRLRQANGLDLARARARSPVATWLQMPLGTGFAAMTAHERRHLWQARQVMQAPGFPR